jgi:hypothetical protein
MSVTTRRAQHHRVERGEHNMMKNDYLFFPVRVRAASQILSPRLAAYD